MDWHYEKEKPRYGSRPLPGERWVTIGEKGLVVGTPVWWQPIDFIHEGYEVVKIFDSGMVKISNESAGWSGVRNVEPKSLLTRDEMVARGLLKRPKLSIS